MRTPQSDDEALRERLLEELRQSLVDNPKALGFLDFLEQSQELQSLITHGNTLVVERLNYNDHGLTHSRLASRNALNILELLRARGVEPTVVKEKWGNYQDAQLVVLGAAYLHDLGNAVHREKHYLHSLYLATPILREYFNANFPCGIAQRLLAQTLECIYSHDEAVQCLSVEAGCVTIGDGADMAGGRARIPFSLGQPDIHALSALAIRTVTIREGEDRPVRVEVEMTGSAGIFQVQEVLGLKIRSSGLTDHVEVCWKVLGNEEEMSGVER